MGKDNRIAELYKYFLKSQKISTDTRNIEEGSLFFALKGPNFNANQFAKQALNSGAILAIIDEEEFLEQNDSRYFLVPDVLQCLQNLASYHRLKFKIPVIGIGGSNGKTTTKELVAAVLNKRYNTLYTLGNLNNHIGVPLTLLRISEETEMAVIEMGANHIGEMEELSKIAQPNFGLITNIGKEHLEGFGSLEGVAKGESELYYWLLKHDGTAFVNANDEWLCRMAGRLHHTYRYGYDYKDKKIINTQVKAELISSNPVEFRVEGFSGTCKMSLSGVYNFENALTALAIGRYFNVEFSEIFSALAGYLPKNNRSQWLEGKKYKIFMDAYNANPSSMEVAIKAFAEEEGKKVLIMGDMFELGEHAASEHKLLLNIAEELNFEKIILVGSEFVKANKDANHLAFENTQLAKEYLIKTDLKADKVMLKASRGVGLEKLVEVL